MSGLISWRSERSVVDAAGGSVGEKFVGRSKNYDVGGNEVASAVWGLARDSLFADKLRCQPK